MGWLVLLLIGLALLLVIVVGAVILVWGADSHTTDNHSFGEDL